MVKGIHHKLSLQHYNILSSSSTMSTQEHSITGDSITHEELRAQILLSSSPYQERLK